MESNTYTVNGREFELQHHGVKGMKWGVRKRYLNADGSLNDRGVKKYAKKGYAQDSFRSNKTVGGKIWDAYTGAHKMMGDAKYATSSKKQNRERAEKYLASKKKAAGKKSAKKTLQKIGGSTIRGAAKTASYGAQFMARMMQNNVAYGMSGAIVNSIYR